MKRERALKKCKGEFHYVFHFQPEVGFKTYFCILGHFRSFAAASVSGRWRPRWVVAWRGIASEAHQSRAPFPGNGDVINIKRLLLTNMNILGEGEVRLESEAKPSSFITDKN